MTVAVKSVSSSYRFQENRSLNVRWMGSQDEEAFQDLLQSTYGSTYSYQALYRKGGYTRLLESKRFLGFGEFTQEGKMISHTGFSLKDPKKDYVESGMSMRRSMARGSLRTQQVEVWQKVIENLRQSFSFMHQNTTTLHPLAQKYAEKMMHAVSVGILCNYATGEELWGFSQSKGAMTALVMSTVLKRPSQIGKTCYLPEGAWGDWLSSIISRLGLGRMIVRADEATHGVRSEKDTLKFSFEAIEWNPALRLERRYFGPIKNGIGTPIISSARARTDLIHVPLDNATRVAEAFPFLFSNGFVPVAVRPHEKRADEVVFQHIVDSTEAVQSVLENSKFYNSASETMVNQWAKLVRSAQR